MTFTIDETVGEIVSRDPALSRVFEQAGIDYCCGGKMRLKEACAKRGLDVAVILNQLERSGSGARPRRKDPNTMSLTQLVDHIEQTHHAYLRSELPRLDGLARKVASVHGREDERLKTVRSVFTEMAQELFSHMVKEERVLFPFIRALDSGAPKRFSPCGPLANPIRQMELEHDEAGSALERLRELTDGYVAPEWACNTYRALLSGLHELETDLHMHIHKENNILFPKALKLEGEGTN